MKITPVWGLRGQIDERVDDDDNGKKAQMKPSNGGTTIRLVAFMALVTGALVAADKPPDHTLAFPVGWDH
jgi:hypothetical protein